jgi:hypothetical protein
MGTFRRRAALLILVAAPPLAAQDIEAAAAEVRWQVDAAGRVGVWPDPAAGGAGVAFRPLADPIEATTWMNLGLAGYLALLAPGRGDLLAMADARRFFERLGEGPEDIVRRLGSPPPAADADRPTRLRHILAVHAAADLGLRPALGPLARLAGSADPSLRAAAAAAIAALRGAPPAALPAAERPLAEVLAELPARPALVLVLDQTRLPSPRPLAAFASAAGAAVTRDMIQRAGGSVSPAAWAGALQFAETPGVLPYELARRYGDHRCTRTVAALYLDDRGEPWAAISLEGAFDIEALAAGLATDAIPTRRDGAELGFDLPAGYRLTATATRLRIETADRAGPAMGAEAAASLVDELGGLPIALRIAEVPAFAPFDELPFAKLLPEQIGLEIPLADGAPLRAEMRFATANLAGAVAGQLAGLARLVEPEVESGALPEWLLERLEALEVEHEGRRVRLRIVLPPLDGELADALLRLGLR